MLVQLVSSASASARFKLIGRVLPLVTLSATALSAAASSSLQVLEARVPQQRQQRRSLGRSLRRGGGRGGDATTTSRGFSTSSSSSSSSSSSPTSSSSSTTSSSAFTPPRAYDAPSPFSLGGLLSLAADLLSDLVLPLVRPLLQNRSAYAHVPLARDLFQRAVEHSSSSVWSEQFALPRDEFTARSRALPLHIWLLHTRLRQEVQRVREGEALQSIGDSRDDSAATLTALTATERKRREQVCAAVNRWLLELWWADVTPAIGEKVGGLLQNKRLMQYQTEMFGFIRALDLALEGAAVVTPAPTAPESASTAAPADASGTTQASTITAHHTSTALSLPDDERQLRHALLCSVLYRNLYANDPDVSNAYSQLYFLASYLLDSVDAMRVASSNATSSVSSTSTPSSSSPPYAFLHAHQWSFAAVPTLPTTDTPDELWTADTIRVFEYELGEDCLVLTGALTPQGEA